MPALQWKIGDVVVKSIHAFYLRKRKFAVAFAAIVAKFIVVHICVAIGTIGKRKPRELLKFPAIADANRMALFTTDGLVFTYQRIIGAAMVEPRRRTKGILVVTRQAIPRQGILMVVWMAREAFRSQAQIGFPFLFLRNIMGDFFLFMAIGTVYFGMFPLEFVPAQIMVELVLIEPCDIKIEPKVLAMALGAFIAFHLRRSMVTFT